MSASSSAVETALLQDKLLSLMIKPAVQFAEIESVIKEEFDKTLNNQSIDVLTDLRHLISFAQTKQFNNPLLALNAYLDKKTNFISRKALISAILMTPSKEDKSYELICYLAQHNRLEQFTRQSIVPSLKLVHEDGRYEEHNTWYLLFELFGLCKDTPSNLIYTLSQWIVNTNPELTDLNIMRALLTKMNSTIILMPEYFQEFTIYFHNTHMIEKITALLSKLHERSLLRPDIVEAIIPLLQHAHYIDAFITTFQLEFQSQDALPTILAQLPTYCRIAKPSEDNYDDKIDTNTPLHQAVIEQNITNLSIALSFANKMMLLRKSYENTALVLACKLADREAAHLILAQMRQAGCDVNQQDSHGMTALHWANFYHFDNLIAELLEAEANPHLNSLDGKSCDYFYHHQFTMNDFKKAPGEIIEGTFKLNNPSITDISFHMDKIALNLKLTSPETVMEIYHSAPMAQIRSSNRFQLFFSAFRDKLVAWLNRPETQHSLNCNAPAARL